jgi:O-acetylserine/cysteine efflux transporter
MKSRDILLAVMTSVLWGLSFIATRYGVDEFTPAQLTVLRFAVAALPALILPRPRVPWHLLVAVGGFWFLLQFLLFFWSFREGMPPGVASVVQQTSAPFTVLLAALLLRETPSRRQLAGMAVAFAGLTLIGLSTGADLPLPALMLTLAAALSWSFGNIVIKRMPLAPMLALTAWMALVAPLPALLLSHLLGDPPLIDTIANASWRGLLSVVYLGTLSTGIAYAAWGYLLARYPAAVVTPFALLVPCTGILASVIVFGETFPPLRYSGIALVMIGIAIIVLRGRRAPLRKVPPA